MNLATYVLAAGRDRPGHPALERHPGGTTWTYGDLLARVEARAGGLAALDLPRGGRVLMRLGNRPDFPVTFLACCAAGLVPIPTSAQLTAPEVQALATRLTPTLTVADPDLPAPDGVPAVTPDALDAGPLPYDRWAQAGPDDLGYIVLTSGSGGSPKAVAHAHRAIAARRAMFDGWYGLTPDDRMLHAGAFNWTYTLGTGLLDPWTRGATALVTEPGTDASAQPGLLASARATIFAAAPGIYRRMLRAPVPPLPHLRHGLSAGEALPPALRAAWEGATGTTIHEALGMSECSTYVSGSPARPAPEGTVGYIQPGRRVDLDGDRIRILRGELGLMLGYWEDGAVAPVGAVFDTGDRAEAGPDGALRYLGRADDLLNPGGHRVSPLEVEAALSDLPVADLAVGQVTTETGATILAAYYVADRLDEAAADAMAAARLAAWKRPRAWLRRDALPRNANGKLRRRELRYVGKETR